MTTLDIFGRPLHAVAEEYRTAGMTWPVRCARCHRGIYDLATVEVTARYADCSVWRTPCCDQTVDDRGETGWTSRKDYHRLPTTPAWEQGRDAAAWTDGDEGKLP